MAVDLQGHGRTADVDRPLSTVAKIGTAMKHDFDLSRQIATIEAPTLIVAADADMFPPAHAIERFALLGGGLRGGGWDGSGRPKSGLAILPGLSHYTIFAAPELAAVAKRFLDDETTVNQRPYGVDAEARPSSTSAGRSAPSRPD